MVTVTTILSDLRDVWDVIEHSMALPELSTLSFQGSVPQDLVGYSWAHCPRDRISAHHFHTDGTPKPNAPVSLLYCLSSSQPHASLDQCWPPPDWLRAPCAVLS